MARRAAVWFRRDLRVHDHPALCRAVEEFDDVVPVFVLDDALLGGRYRSDTRVRFMLACLEELDAALRERGSGLTVLRGRPEKVLGDLGADAILHSADVSPYARARDARVEGAVALEGNHVVDLGELRPRRVFTPFMRAWEEVPRRSVLPAPDAIPGGQRGEGVPDADELGIGPGVPSPAVAAGEHAARAALEAWLDGPADHYGGLHSSRLSPYLRWGCLSARECEERAAGHAPDWVRQLAWRDFYAHNLLHNPHTLRVEQQERFRDLEWDDDPELFAAWAEGRTGFPFVDAGMRELAATGWMPNRVRLVCGSLLTKELHLDWRLGEQHFARLLLDGEPAQNNGNWQWIAGTGTDPAPYFRRMYNPERHQQRFDPDGEYVARWAGPEGYPEPVIDRAAERERAAQRYRAAAGR